MQKPDKIVTTTYLLKKTITNAKVFAAKTHQSISAVMDKALNEHMQSNKAHNVKE